MRRRIFFIEPSKKATEQGFPQPHQILRGTRYEVRSTLQKILPKVVAHRLGRILVEEFCQGGELLLLVGSSVHLRERVAYL